MPRKIVTEHYYAIFPSSSWKDENIAGVLRRTYKGARWFDEVWGEDGWVWSPIYAAKDSGGDHAFRFSVITEGEAANIIKRLDK
jgi:hypothetical protein